MIIELQRSIFGFNQDCTLDIENKSDGVHITVLKAKYPTLIDHDVICHLVNLHKNQYQVGCNSVRSCKESANKGFLAEEVSRLEFELATARFTQKIAKRNKVIVFDNTGN